MNQNSPSKALELHKVLPRSDVQATPAPGLDPLPEGSGFELRVDDHGRVCECLAIAQLTKAVQVKFKGATAEEATLSRKSQGADTKASG